MTVPEIYDYLVRARRDLWATLEGVPDEVLSRQVLDGKRLHSDQGPHLSHGRGRGLLASRGHSA
ncbi:MAG: hypothetical protein WA869_37325 [Alloacidobacterium sp.]